jgi:hypothetical protein
MRRVVLLAAAWAGFGLAAPAFAESPMTHDRDPLRYQWMAPPVPQSARPTQPGRPSAGEAFIDPETRRGLSPKDREAIRKLPEDDGKREMVGDERLWTTRDPPGRRGVFAFMGNKVGDPIENIFPDPEEKDQFGMKLCRETPGVPGWLDCTDDSIRQMVNGVWKLMYRGVEVSFVSYRYLDGKLVGFRMGFPTANFQKLAEVLIRQYGPPTNEEESSWQHRLGGIFDIKTQAWNTPVGEMTLKSRAASLDAGMLALLEPKAEARYNEMRFRQVAVPARPAALSDEGFVIHPPKGPAADGEARPAAASPPAPAQ